MFNLVFSLPFCLLLPDGDYEVKLGEDDIVILNLTKVIPKTFDERIPYRGFKKGEIDNISRLNVVNLKVRKAQWIDVSEIKNLDGMSRVFEYVTKDGKTIDLIKPYLIDGEDVNSKRIKKKDKELKKDIRENNHESENENYKTLIINAEIKEDRHGRLRYTKVRFRSIKRFSYYQNIKRAVEAVNLLISTYRLFTGSYWISNIKEEDVFIDKEIEGITIYPFPNFVGLVPIRNDYGQNIVDYVKEALIEGVKEPPFFQLKLNAINALTETNYTLAIIYIITALESSVRTYLRYHSNEKDTKRITHTPLKELIPILKEKLSCNELPISEEKLNEAIDLKDNIICFAETVISRQVAIEIVRCVEKFIRFLSLQTCK